MSAISSPITVLPEPKQNGDIVANPTDADDIHVIVNNNEKCNSQVSIILLMNN